MELEEREKKFSTILIFTFRPTKALGYLTQTLTLLLLDDTSARTIVAESDVVPVLLDLLLRTLRSKESGISDKDTADNVGELPKWVPTVLLTLDSLAQLPLSDTPLPEVCFDRSTKNASC